MVAAVGRRYCAAASSGGGGGGTDASADSADSKGAAEPSSEPSSGPTDEQLRTRILDDAGQSDTSKGNSVARHLFRSPFEVAGVRGYSMPEVEHVFGTRSSDSVFWPIFSTFHTLLPHEVDEPPPDEGLDEFLAG